MVVTIFQICEKTDAGKKPQSNDETGKTHENVRREQRVDHKKCQKQEPSNRSVQYSFSVYICPSVYARIMSVYTGRKSRRSHEHGWDQTGGRANCTLWFSNVNVQFQCSCIGMTNSLVHFCYSYLSTFNIHKSVVSEEDFHLHVDIRKFWNCKKGGKMVCKILKVDLSAKPWKLAKFISNTSAALAWYSSILSIYLSIL